MKPAVILTDIEGTTTAIDFVHKVLFPYAHEQLEQYIAAHTEEPAVKELLNTVAKEASTNDTVGALKKWMEEDRKHTALKSLQGLIWEDGYKKGDFTGHLYPDVKPKLEEWRAAGITLGVYSSGSAHAQRLLFGHTEVGDLTPLFSHYFDTTIGQKKEAASYQNIVAKLGIAPEAILFLSDVEAELDAAAAAGMRTTQLVRPGTTAGTRHTTATTFQDITL